MRWYLVGGILAGILYAVASGAGLPLATKVVLPLIFESTEQQASNQDLKAIETWIRDSLGVVDRDQLVMLTCAWLPLMFVLRAIGGFFSGYWISFCGFRFLEQMREDVFTRLQKLPVAFFQKYSSGDLLARLVGDAEVLRQTSQRLALDIVKQPAQFLAAIVFLGREAFLNNGLVIVLAALLAIPVCIFPLRAIAKKLKRRAKALQATAGDLSGEIAETLQAPLEVRAYNLQDHVRGKFQSHVGNLVRYSMKVVKYRQLVGPSVEVFAVTGLTIALYLGAQRADMTQTQFITIATAIYMCYDPIKKMGALHTLIEQAKASIDRLEDITERSEPEPENPTGTIPAAFQPSIAFKEVSFGYDKDLVLDRLNFEVKPGECVALVGPSGGGKTTLFNLIPRFFEAQAGEVSVGGQDVKKWPLAALRDHIAVVLQTPILFRGTIRENIRLGRPGATDAEIEEAAKNANAHDFIMAQPKGYDTLVTEKGTSLSGGQRQRLSIARAFLKDAPILLLDEATSALDNESEAKIQAALETLTKGRTTLLIAHRLSTTEIADRVVEIGK